MKTYIILVSLCLWLLPFTLQADSDGSHQEVRGAEVEKTQEKTEAESPTPPAAEPAPKVDWETRFKKALEFLDAKEKALNQLNLSIAAGFSGNSAGDKNLYKLDFETNINKGVCPHSFEFMAGSSAQIQDNVFSENVTTMLISYDYHLLPWLETYGFIERFSNSYLSIQHRYEVGAGIKFEKDFGLLKGIRRRLGVKNINKIYEARKPGAERIKEEYSDTYRDHSKAFGYYSEHSDEFNALAKEISGSIEGDGLRLDEIKDKERRVLTALSKTQSRLSIGLALTVFSELEKALIETHVFDDLLGGIQKTCEPIEVTWNPEHRFRVVVRPSFTYRPSEILTVKGQFYVKLPLGDPYKDDKLDYRTDLRITAKFKIPSFLKFSDSMSLNLEYNRHFDNCPPEIPGSILDEYTALGQSLDPVIAESIHQEIKFRLEVSF
jgi:hypothetical protein